MPKLWGRSLFDATEVSDEAVEVEDMDETEILDDMVSLVRRALVTAVSIATVRVFWPRARFAASRIETALRATSSTALTTSSFVVELLELRLDRCEV